MLYIRINKVISKSRWLLCDNKVTVSYTSQYFTFYNGSAININIYDGIFLSFNVPLKSK